VSLFFRSKAVKAGSLKVAKYFRVYLPQFGDPKFPKIREYPGHFEKDIELF